MINVEKRLRDEIAKLRRSGVFVEPLCAIAVDVAELEVGVQFATLAIEHFNESDVCRHAFEKANPELVEAMADIVVRREAAEKE